jgi:hypothetical protein
MTTTIAVSDYVAVHDALDGLHHVLLDWHLWTQEHAPAASGHLLRASSCLYDATEALRLCTVDVCSAMVPPDHEE